MAAAKSTGENTAGKTTATPRKTAGTRKPRSTTVAKKTTTPRAPRKTAKYIRNLRGVPVHARLYSQNPKDPFRVALEPRGRQGDTTVVPVALIDDSTFLKGVGVLWEVITETEYKQIQYGPVGYLGRDDAPKVERPEDTTVMTADDWDGKGRRVPEERNIQGRVIKRTESGRQTVDRLEHGTGMYIVDVPGSDSALAAGAIAAAEQGGSTALPEGVDLQSRRVVIERAS